MSNLPDSTIHARTLNQRAPKDKERLFQGLECFANLGDSFKDYCAFAQKWPTFWPIEARDKSTDQPLGLLQNRSYHPLATAMRDYLRRVWRSEDQALKQQVPGILLGLKHDTAKGGPEEPVSQTDFVFKGLLAILALRPNTEVPHPTISIDWIRGEFSYSPLNDFQRAVYLLFRENWRARICPQCGRLFVAAKPAQLYCSVPCGLAARRQRDLDWWRTKGAANRQSRKSQTKRSKLGRRLPKKGKRDGN
jgi:hypothetical protein